MTGVRSIKTVLLLGSAVICMLAALAGPSLAYAEMPWWHLSSDPVPASLAQGGQGTIVVVASNLGDADVNAVSSPVTIADTLPPGLQATAIEGVAGESATQKLSGNRGPVNCVRATLTCTYGQGLVAPEGILPPYEHIEILISVKVAANAQSGENSVSVSGGGAQSASLSRPVALSGAAAAFGPQDYELTAEEEGGAPTFQAGAHPFQLTSTLMLNRLGPETPVAMAKDLSFKLPPGLIGNPTPFAQCTEAQFMKPLNGADECPANTAVGVAAVTIYEYSHLRLDTLLVPVFNLEPRTGEPARFGFQVQTAWVSLDTSVRTGGDYGVTVSVENVSQEAEFLASQVTFWGVPGIRAHDSARGWSCIAGGQYETAAEALGLGACAATPISIGGTTPPPFLSTPTSCSGPLQSSVEGDSWQRRGSFTAPLGSEMQGMDSCNKLRFEPTIKAAPDVEDAATPTGLAVDVHVPQDLQTVSSGTAESAVKRIEVALPQGVTVNPGGADGLTSCSEQQIGVVGPSPSAISGFQFTEKLPEPLEPGVNFCPDSSKIATVKIKTPLLPNPLEGFVYLATPSINGELGDNPFNSLISMYLVAKDPVSGVLVKLPMHVSLDGSTGQIVTTVDNPELPFEDAELHFFGGSRAPLVTPGLCGSYTTNATFTPWSGNEAVHSTATFTITSGPNGSACPSSPRPFTPGFQAGTTNLQAGAFTPLTTTLGHPDEDQPLGAISMTLPPGLMGSLSGVKLCPEPQANEGTCGSESLIGHTTVTAGLGSTPAVVARPGNVYITGPYNGRGACKVGEGGCAPFGLTIANPAETGPFDLEKGTPCDCIVVRAKVEVDPLTAQLRIVSGPLPTMLKGIALDLQHVNVTVDRPGFTLNPTNCAKMAIAGTIGGAEGASAPVSSSFQVTNCATLGFKPAFSVSTAGKTSRAKGASLDVKLSYPKAPWGSQANIRSVKVSLPRQLPSRLTTLQKACPDSTFNANPAACPAASKVGTAKAVTPIIPVPLEGPAYFVSHGGAKFPELIVVLQGYGVTLDLHGETFISRAGITSSTFRTIPDAPVGTFELKLPQGPYSALAANGSLCKSALKMPTAFTAQNGATLKQSTPIEVTGCPYALVISSKSVKNGTLTLKVSVPQAGKLTATGKGLTSAAKSASGRQTLTLTLKERKAGKLRTSVLLRFTPAKGKQRKALRKTLHVAFG